MEMNSALKISRIRLTLILFFNTFFAFGQQLNLIDSVSIVEPDLSSLDRNGNIYISDVKGNIYQYSANLEKKQVFSPDKPARITFMDAWQGLRVFCFYRDVQEFVLLDRFLASSSLYGFDDPKLTFISAATVAFDNKLWLLDQPSVSLIKYDIRSRGVEFAKPLELILSAPFTNILLFREYQNKIYLLDGQNGLLVFDNLGNYISNQKFLNISNAGFYGDYFYYQKNLELIFTNLYRNESHSIKIPENRIPENILRSEFGVYIIDRNYLYKYIVK